MPWPRSSTDDDLRYLRQTPGGKWVVRIYINIIDTQVYFGTFATLEEAQVERDRQERKYDVHSPCVRYKPVKPRTSKVPRKALYNTAI